MKLSDPVTSLQGVGESQARGFERLGVNRAVDLLMLLPRRIEDRSKLVEIASLRPGDEAVIEGEVSKIHSRRTKRGGLLIEARVSDRTGSIAAVWFNQRYLLSQLRVGQRVVLFGAKKLAPALGNPFVVKKIIAQAGFAPIYPATKGLHQGHIARAIKQVLPLAGKVGDALPPEIGRRYRLVSRRQALLGVHQPTSPTELAKAVELFAFEELLGLALSVRLNKKEQRAQRVDKLVIDGDYLKKIVAKLPFALTNSQRRAAWEIIKGMSHGYPANRLLYGEVGSGKTAVALIAAVAIVRSGSRVLLLVPTTTLAAQQAKNLRVILGEETPVGLVTGSVKQAPHSPIVVGTHALLSQAKNFQDIGLVIIDEQQRFGVRQRQELLRHHTRAHLLMTTATPIPRSLAQTIFGNLDITYLLDKPAHQQKVTTKRFTGQQRPSVLTEIRRRIGRGEPGYVICPAIEEGETEGLLETEIKSVGKEAKILQQELPGARIAVLHGQLPNEQKTKILLDFLRGGIDCLVSTTVVEVGIDNEAASWMIIENAEMFGLSTLHQLRGRIGRGERASVCFLAQSLPDERSQKRLAMLEKSQNGLELAEADLSLRGPGELLGQEQSGLPNLRFASLGDKKLVQTVFELAEEIIKEGIDNYPTLKPLIKRADGLATG